jgi:hypothetical protein
MPFNVISLKSKWMAFVKLRLGEETLPIIEVMMEEEDVIVRAALGSEGYGKDLTLSECVLPSWKSDSTEVCSVRLVLCFLRHFK